MKEEKMLRAFSLVDDDLVENAAPKEKKPKIPLWWKRFAYVAVAACLMLVILLPVMFGGGHDSVPVVTQSSGTDDTDIPSDTTSPSDAYKDSAYYPLIQQLAAYYQKQEELLDSLRPGKPMYDGVFTTVAVATVPAPSEPETPDDITDNQVAGVVEADLIKRTNTHIFYLRDHKLEAYSIKGKDSAKVGAYSVADGGCNGFYLLDNGKKALVLSFKEYSTVALLLDVSDPTDIKEIKKVSVDGTLADSRVTDDKILLFTNYYIKKEKVDYTKPATFVPTVTEDGKETPLSAADIMMIPEQSFYASYSVVYALDAKTLDVEGSKALVGSWGQFYVSKSHIVFAKSRYSSEEKDGYRYSKHLLDVICLSYTDGIAEKGQITLNGYTKDQYSFDEKDGILRVVTTVSERVYQVYHGSSASSGSPSIGVAETRAAPFETTAHPEPGPAVPDETTSVTPSSYTGASLYCVSLDSFEVVASVERFAPAGETVQSVRFDGNYAYVCTSIVFTDPVFFFDLSDLNHITYTDTGVIEGYSSSLVQFGEGNLLGIGFEDFDTVKIEVYREEEGKVVSVDRYLIENASIASEYKAYYVDRKNQLLGFGMIDWMEDRPFYVLLHFDGEKLTELVNLPTIGAIQNYRSVYLDGFLYVFTAAGLNVVEATIPKQ